MIIIFHKRFFELSEEVKKMFLFTETLNLKAASMNKNKRLYNHASQVIKILDKIIILLANSSVNCEDKIKLVELGKRHYHFGLKKEYFKVLFRASRGRSEEFGSNDNDDSNMSGTSPSSKRLTTGAR